MDNFEPIPHWLSDFNTRGITGNDIADTNPYAGHSYNDSFFESNLPLYQQSRGIMTGSLKLAGIKLNSSTIYNLTISENGTVNDTSTNREMPEIPLYIYITVSIMYFAIFLLGVCGNLLVIVVILRSRTMRNPTNWLLLNLSVSDLLVILVCMPTAFVDLFAKDVWYFGAFMCHMVPYLENTTFVSSVLSIIAISCERFIAICKHSSYSRPTLCSHKAMTVVILTLWAISCVVCIPLIQMAKYKDSEHLDGTPIKVCRMYTNGTLRLVYVTTISILFYPIPCVILIVIYHLIIKHILRETMELSTEEASNISRKNSLLSRRQAIYMLRTVTLLFFALLLPWLFLRLYLSFAEIPEFLSFEGYITLIYFCRVLFYLNSAVNPIVYNIFSSKFRQAFKRTLRMKLERRTSDRSMTFTSAFINRQNLQTEYKI